MGMRVVVNRRRSIALWAGLVLALVGCATAGVPLDDLFPPQVGEFLRTGGPSPDPATSVDWAIYQGPEGAVTLRIKRVGRSQIEHALSELPPMATGVGYDPALGQREGVFFTFASEYHAAWGNGDWVFILSASTEAARAAFLASYGF